MSRSQPWLRLSALRQNDRVRGVISTKTSALVASSFVFLMMMSGCSSIERSLLYYPTHSPETNGLAPWVSDGTTIGYSRMVASPKNVWLMLHGNAGQASSRAYAIHCFSSEDSVFILEYPGYGNRKGVPSKESLNHAAKEAYLSLRERFPGIPVCVVGESIGSGPAASLASLSPPPDKYVLVVPFDKLSLVAREHLPGILVSLLLTDNWDNVAAFANYKGPVEIYGAKSDSVIPVSHARALSAAVASSKFILIDGGHNDWSHQDAVRIRNP